MRKIRIGEKLQMCWWESLLKLAKSMYAFFLYVLFCVYIVSMKYLLYYIYIYIFFRQYSVEYKLDTYLKIARLYLEDDDPVQAEAFINRASLLQAESKDEQLQIYYKV